MLSVNQPLMQDLRDLIVKVPPVADLQPKERSDLLLFGLPKRLTQIIEPHHDPEIHIARIIQECANWGMVGSGTAKEELALAVVLDNVERLVVELPALQSELKSLRQRVQILTKTPAAGLKVAPHIPADQPLATLLQGIPYAGTVYQATSGYSRTLCLFADLVLEAASSPVFCLIKIDDFSFLELEYNTFNSIKEKGPVPGFIPTPIAPPIPLRARTAALILRITHSTLGFSLPLQQLLQQGRHRTAATQLKILADLWFEWNFQIPQEFRKHSEALRNSFDQGQPRQINSGVDVESFFNEHLFGISHPKPPPAKAWLRFEGVDGYLPNPIAYLNRSDLWPTPSSLPFMEGQVCGCLSTGNIWVQMRRDSGDLVENARPFLADLDKYTERGCYIFDWAYLELDILHQFVSFHTEIHWDHWVDLINHVTTEYQLPSDYRGEFGGKSRDAFTFTHQLRELIALQIAGESHTLEQNFWLSGVAAGLRYACLERQLPEERAASLYYASRCLSKLLPNLIYDGQDSQFVPISYSSQERLYLEDLAASHQVWKELFVPLTGEKQTPVRQKRVLSDAARELLAMDSRTLKAATHELPNGDSGNLRGDIVVRNGRLLGSPIPVERIDDTITDLQQVILLGSPGSGKTTTLRWLAYQYSIQAFNDPSAPIPILVPLGGWSADTDLKDYIVQNFRNLGPRLERYLSPSSSRSIMLLLDGLNEMPRTHIGVIRQLLWQARFPFVVTCRTMDYQNDLQDLENLSVVKIRELDPKKIRNFIDNYLEEDAVYDLFAQLGGSAEILQAVNMFEKAGLVLNFWDAVHWNDIPWQYGTTDDPILDAYLELLSDRRRLIWLARTPYMLRMIVEIYDTYGSNLPKNRGELFQRFVQTLLNRAYIMREAGTDQVQPNILLSALSELAYAMQTSDERTQIEYNLAVMHLKQKFLDQDVALLLQVAQRAYFIDLLHRSIRFRHQLLQEYFAAQILRQSLDQGQTAQYYWHPNSWWLPTGWEETAILLTGVHESPEKVIHWLQEANPELARRCFTEGGTTFPVGTEENFRTTLQGFVHDVQRPILVRAYAAQTLGRLKDDRPGIASRVTTASSHRNPLSQTMDDVKPDILWVAIQALDAFQLGLSEEDILDSYDDLESEKPASTHHIKSFWISRYPITNAQYAPFFATQGLYNLPQWWTAAGNKWRRSIRRYTPNDPYNLPNHPAVFVSWYEAFAYTQWLTQKLKVPIRLPTELEWEVAASFDPSMGKKYRYPWGNTFEMSRCNSSDLNYPYPSMVTLFPTGASPSGVFDMVGNVWEWCSTVWQSDWLDSGSSFSYPYDSNDGREQPEYQRAKRVIRGSCYLDAGKDSRVTRRAGCCASSRLGGLGFRVVTDIDPGTV